jgi:hypothetical protein
MDAIEFSITPIRGVRVEMESKKRRVTDTENIAAERGFRADRELIVCEVDALRIYHVISYRVSRRARMVTSET